MRVWVCVYVCVLQPSTLPLTCNRAVYLISAAGFLATHVYSPECVADNEGILSSELYWSNMVTLAPNSSGNGSPSLSQISLRGASPRETPQTVRVRIPSARPSWNANGSMIGGTASRKEQAHMVKSSTANQTHTPWSSPDVDVTIPTLSCCLRWATEFFFFFRDFSYSVFRILYVQLNLRSFVKEDIID